MNTKKINIIYMGTPDFSVGALLNLAAQKNFQISLVVTQPDRPKGRGKKLAFSPVKIAAQKIGLDVFQPENINSTKSLEKIESYQPDFFVVAAFGQILSQKVLDIPKVYPINIHASLLPKYRGSSPIQAAILNMDDIAGVTTMVMAKKLDAGDILLSASTTLSENDTAQDLHDKLSSLGADLIVKTINGITKNCIKPVPQDHSKASYVKMLKKNDGEIDWNLSNRQICAHINAMTPWPGAFTKLDGKRLKIFKAVPYKESSDSCTGRSSDHSSGPSPEYDAKKETQENMDNYSCNKSAPGVIFQCDKQGIHVSTAKGLLTILELMGSSGKRLQAFQFLCGHTIDTPARFDN